MKIYGNPFSTCTRKVLATLAEKGKEVEMVMVDLGKGEQKNPEYLKRQPFGKVPALEDDGFQLYESRAIIRYLDDKLPGIKLTPADPKQRATMEQWSSVEYSYFSPTAMKIVYQKIFHPMRGQPVDMEVVKKAKEDLGRTLDVMEAQLGKTPYIAGDSFTLADIGYMPYLEYVFAGQEGDVVEARPHVAAWWKRISARPSWKKAIGKG